MNGIEYRIYDDKRELIHQRLDDVGISVNLSASKSSSNQIPQQIDLDKDALFCEFISNYDCWNEQNCFFSINNFDNENFKKIVEMGEAAVPNIYKIIKEAPNQIVHALDLIYPNLLTYEGNVPLKDVCDAWTTILPIMKVV